MGVDWGSVPDWVATIATSGTLITGMALLVRERHERHTFDADNLRATLDVLGEDLSGMSPLAMTVTNHGTTSFEHVRVYRCADVLVPGDDRRLRWYRADLGYIAPRSEFQWVVLPKARLMTGLDPHPRSFEVFEHRAEPFIRYRTSPLQKLDGLHVRRRARQQREEFEVEHGEELEVLTFDKAAYRFLDARPH